MSKSSKLASELMTAAGIVCLRVSVLAGHPGYSKVAIGGIADRASKCHRIWLQSTNSAEKLISELFRTCGMRRGGAIVIEAAPDETDRLLRASAQLLGIAVIEDDRIDSLMASLTKRVADAVDGMGRAGTLKALRRVTEHPDISGLLLRQ